MSLLIKDIITDQCTSASAYIKAHAPSVCTSMKVKCAVCVIKKWFRKYWGWLICILVLRKLLKVLSRSKTRSVKKLKTRRLNRIANVENDEEHDKNSSESADNASTFDRSSYFAPSVNSAPSPASHMIFSDDVIVVNRDNRYVEVYERRPSSSDKYDRKVAALMKEFRPRK